MISMKEQAFLKKTNAVPQVEYLDPTNESYDVDYMNAINQIGSMLDAPSLKREFEQYADQHNLGDFKNCNPDDFVTVGKIAYILNRGGSVSAETTAFMLRESASIKQPKKQIQKTQTPDYITVAALYDDIEDAVFAAVQGEQVNPVAKVKIAGVTKRVKKKVAVRTQELLNELSEWDTCDQVREAYAYLGKRKVNKAVKLLNQVIDELDKSAARKSKNSTKPVARENSKQQHMEFSGAKFAVFFDQKYQTAVVMYSDDGLELKSKTIQNINFEKSFEVRASFADVQKAVEHLNFESLKNKPNSVKTRYRDSFTLLYKEN